MMLKARKLFVATLSAGTLCVITNIWWFSFYSSKQSDVNSLTTTAELPTEFFNDEFLGNNVNSNFPLEESCHFFGLRKEAGEKQTVSQPEFEIACKPHRPTNEACNEANNYFGEPGTVINRSCNELQHPDICVFQRPSGSHQQKLTCDLQLCGGKASVGTMDKALGKITQWKTVNSTNAVLEIVRSTIADGFNFCFVECGEIKQVLWFLPKLKVDHKWKADERININILLLDSVARPHFYRVLPKAVKALRDIIYTESIPATALDFELLQGLGQHTFENIRPIFSGLIGGNEEFSSSVKKDETPLGITVLYGKYQSLGYQTVFQEDLCWFDRWGIHLTDLERRTPPSSDSQYQSRWAEFNKKISKYHLDQVGITHFSCEVYKRYRQTNPYDVPDKICLNGQFFEKYYLDYSTAMFNSVERDHSAPVVSYQHLNTAHTTHGTRIINLDRILANYFTKMAHDGNTLTIVLADHGHTRTSYAETLEGRFELFNPTMFMIVPNHVAHLLGKERMTALVRNQKRLFTTLDIHKALMTLHDKTVSSDYRTSGIFATISANRTCEDLPLLPLTRCKCDGWDQIVADNVPKHKWLAERALGNINNNIQEQFTKGGKVNGYGRCMRLKGLSYRNIIEHQEGKNIQINFDLHVAPPRGLKEDETFKVALKHSVAPHDGVDVLKVVRHSMYKDFITCQDETVDIKLCVCAQGSNMSMTEKEKDMINLISRPQFGAETKLTDLHAGCLYLMTRTHDKLTIVYEVANVCPDKTFLFSMYVRNVYNMVMTSSLPIEVQVKPRTVHWLVAAVRYVLNDSNLDIKTNVKLV